MSFRALRAALAILWAALGGALVLGVVLSNLPPDGTLNAEAFPGEPSAFVGGLRPTERVKLVDSGAGLHFVVQDEPAYFQLYVPRFFRRAVLRIEYLNEGQPELALGGRADPDEWRFDLKPLETVAEHEGGWTTGEASFDLGALARDARGEVQMVLSIPGMKEGNPAPVRVRRIAAAYERPPLALRSILDALSRKFSP